MPDSFCSAGSNSLAPPGIVDGRLITLEGGEGAGKSTQLTRLAGSLADRGIRIVTTREPGGAPGSELIRSLLVEGDPDRWDPETEALLHYAARREHLRSTIRPALERGDWVISDRFSDSTMAYQGYGHGLGQDWIARLHTTALGDFQPDLTLILDLPVEEGLRRAGRRSGDETRYERMDGGFHERMRQGFLAIADSEPKRCVLIDATGSEQTVAGDILRVVTARLPVS